MEPRRLTGLLALIVALVAIAVVVYFDYRPEAQGTASSAGPAATGAANPVATSDGEGMSSQAKEPAAPGQPGPLAAAEPAKTPAVADGGAMSAAPESPAVDAGGAMMKAETPADGAKPAESPMAAEQPMAMAKAEPPAAAGQPAAPAMPAAPASPPAAAAEPPPGAPSFDIVRVEPTGEAVIAGLAAAGDTVEVMDSGAAIAKAVANDRGEWALTLDNPLKPGTHDLAIRTTSGDKKSVAISDQRVAISISDSKKDEPLVVLSTPDGPSKVLAMPKAPPSAVAAAEPPAAPAAPREISLADAGAEKAVADQPPAAEKPAAPPKEISLADAGAEKAVADQPASGDKPPASGGEKAISLADAGAEKAVADQPAATEKPAAPSQEISLADAGAEKAVADQPAATERPAAPSQEISLADAGAEKAVADQSSAGGKQISLADAGAEAGVAAPADIAAADAGKPGAAPAAEVAATEPKKQAEPPKPAAPVAMVAISAVEADTAGGLFIAGLARTPEMVRVYLDDQLLGDTRPTEGGTWLLEVKREMPAGTYRVRADQIDGKGEVLVRAEVPFERDIEVASLKPVGEAGGSSGTATSGSMPAVETVIIKRTDNLWRISRKMYGSGVRWSTLYQANKDQIRNPRWIFPGQVFVIPTGDTSWKN